MQSSIWKIITAIGIAGVGTLVVLEVQHRLPQPRTASVPAEGVPTSEDTLTPNSESDFDRLMSGADSESGADPDSTDFRFSEPDTAERDDSSEHLTASADDARGPAAQNVVDTTVNRQQLVVGPNPFAAENPSVSGTPGPTKQAAGAGGLELTAVRPVSFLPGGGQADTNPPDSVPPSGFDTGDPPFETADPGPAGAPESQETPAFSADDDASPFSLPESSPATPDLPAFGDLEDRPSGDSDLGEADAVSPPRLNNPPIAAPKGRGDSRKSVEPASGGPMLFFRDAADDKSPTKPDVTRESFDADLSETGRPESIAIPRPESDSSFDTESTVPPFDSLESEQPRAPDGERDTGTEFDPDADSPPVTRPAPRPVPRPEKDPLESDDGRGSFADEDDRGTLPRAGKRPRERRPPSLSVPDGDQRNRPDVSEEDPFPVDEAAPVRRERIGDVPLPRRERAPAGGRDRDLSTFEDERSREAPPRLLPAVDEDRRTTADPERRDSAASSDVIHPHLTIRKKAPPTASVGVPLDYEIIVSNDGQSPASDVIIEDDLPQDVTLEKTQPKADFDRTTRRITWHFDEIAPGQSQHLTVRVIPNGEGTLDGVATVRFKTQVKGSTVITAPRLELDLTGPKEVRLGDEVAFRYLIRNTGSGEAKDVILRSVLPPELRHTEGNDLEYDIKSLRSGDEQEIVLKVIAAREGTHSNRAEITSSGVATASAESQVHVVGTQLKLERLGPERRYVGRTASFQNIITNDTNFEATDATVLEFVPEGMKFSTAPGGEYNSKDRMITWHIDRIAPGKQVVLDVELLAESAGSFDAIVEVVENAGFRSQGTKTIAVEDLHNVSADISRVEGPVAVGEKIKFAITIDNRGTATANEVQLQVQVPAQITILAAGNKEHGIKARKGPGNSVVYNPVLRIEPNEKQTFQLILQGQEPVRNGMVVAQLKYAEMQEPLVVSESVTVFSDAD